MQIGRRQQIIILAMAVVILFGAGYKYACWQAKSNEKPTLERLETGELNKNFSEVVIHVAGAVEKPGVYRLPRGSRVNDVITQAGILPEADLNILNLAALLADGQKITVPFQKKTIPGENAGNTEGLGKTLSGSRLEKENAVTSSGDCLVNINTAGKAELESLPGIGPAFAERIIQYREKNGPFMTPEDIKNVSGIGEKRYEQLKDLISV